MKAALEFELPAEQAEFRMAADGAKWRCVAEGVFQKLRDWLKHGHEFKTANGALEGVRDALVDECEEAGVRLFEDG